MDVDSIQKKIELTEEQEKAFKLLKKAVRACKKSNIYFYHVLETLGALNGDNVDSIIVTDYDPYFDRMKHIETNSLQFLDYPTLQISESFADDTHWVVLKDGE